MSNTNTSGLPECLGFTFDCLSTTPACRNSARFDFPTLWTITSQYAQQCPDGPWLFKTAGSPPTADHLAITDEVCRAIAGSEYKRYPAGDVWTRLTTWKFPLFQLIANSPRPPLGFWVEAFVFVHFCGDPIGTIQDVLRKIDGAQSRAVFWQDCLDNELVLLRDGVDEPEQRRLWKALALIVDSFDEWGLSVGDQAQEYLLTELTELCLPTADRSVRQRYLRVCLQTADALAADRSTKSVPIVIAQAFFIGAVAVAMIRTQAAGNGPTPSVYVNIEIYSIAFTAQYFWVIFAIIWKSIIGVSQSAAAIPRILQRFRWDLEKEVSSHGLEVNLPIEQLDQNNRIYDGGIYSWQPARWKSSSTRSTENNTLIRRTSTHSIHMAKRHHRATTFDLWTMIRAIVPVFVVLMAAATGQLISALVPPEGWSCRSMSMLYMSLAWLVSYILGWVPFCGKYKVQFWATFVKDALITCFTMGIVIWTQLGVFNKCSCYTLNGRMGLQLPFMPAVHDILQSRLSGWYPGVVTLGIAIQLILVPSLLLWKYFAAVQVFLQRDDGTNDMDWWYQFEERTRERWCAMMRTIRAARKVGNVAVVEKRGESVTVLSKVCSVSSTKSDETNRSCTCCRPV